MKWPMIKLGDIAVKKGGTVNPEKFQNEIFMLWSIPAYDNGTPEILAGSAIGSSKKILKENDVLISRIIPHIRRVLVVGKEEQYRQIGSGEWIQYRSEIFHPHFLKHYLSSDMFHKEFMATVSGVGGSLLRARPSEVERIEVPCPPLEEQKRIAAILDKADAIRQKRQQAITLADDFLRSVFLDMFGDPITNPKGWERIKLGDLISSGPTNGLYKPSSAYGSGTRILRIDGFYDGVLSEQEYFKRVEISKEEVSRFSLIERGIVINRVNSPEYLGKCAFIDKLHESTVFESNMMFFTVDEELLNPVFLTQQLQMPNIKHQIKNCSKDAVNQSSINQQDVKSFEILLPNVELQNYFEAVVNEITRGRKRVSNGQSLTDTLFNSISHKVFSCQL